MAQSVQERASLLPRRDSEDSDSHLPAGASAEEGIQITEPGGNLLLSQKSPGSAPSSPCAPDASGTATATAAAAADLPNSKLDLQRAWQLVDWTIALFLCTSVVHFIVRLTVTAGLSACIGIAAAIAHLWQQIWGANCAQALITARKASVIIKFLPSVVIGFGGFIWICSTCRYEDCPFRPVYVVSGIYCVLTFAFGSFISGLGLKVSPWPPPFPRPYMEVVLERIQEYKPLSAEDLRALQIKHLTDELHKEKGTALCAFTAAHGECDRLRQDEAYWQWQEAGEKLKLLKKDPEQYLQRHGLPTVTV